MVLAYRHRSSTTLIMFRRPRWCNFGMGAAASDPSPKNSVPSSLLTLPGVSGFVQSISCGSRRTYSCAASLIVKGRTRTVALQVSTDEVESKGILYLDRKLSPDGRRTYLQRRLKKLQGRLTTY